MKITTVLLLVLIFTGASGAEENQPEAPALPRFHLTAHPWEPLNIPRDAYLDAVEGVCRFSIKHQDTNGAITDPFLKREHQYATPYFAAAVGVLMKAGRARDIWDGGIRAMDRSTACFAAGDEKIPDRHGEFFDTSLAGALAWYQGHVPEVKMQLWRERMATPRARVIQGPNNNWRAYAMRGEWLRTRLGLAERSDTLAFISDCWWHGTQRDRIISDEWNLYHDGKTDPESLAVEAVGRVNLLGLIASGYDGKEREEIRSCAERGTAASLLLQDPSGQCPPNGRADDHVFNDVLYQLAFETMAEEAKNSGSDYLAGQYRRAAMLSFQSTRRWQRTDGEWAGSYFVTKNRFNPARRVGYQAASNYGNYNGAVMLHLAEAYLMRKTDIAESPAPVEIGGYAFKTDDAFSAAVANAGGMQMFVALRGDTQKVYGQYWTALGVERIGRVNWDTRLGPSDGIRDAETGAGVTFAPTWLEDGHWIKMADVPDRYNGRFSVQFVHPLLVRCSIDYRPLPGKRGPEFRQEFVLTPDGILATLRTSSTNKFGVTWPLLENDGSQLSVKITGRTATTAYGPEGDQQCFLSLAEASAAPVMEKSLLSSYGWLRPVRVVAEGGVDSTFIYPRNATDPAAGKVQQGIHFTKDGFRSMLGRVAGNLYVGRTSAGGEGAEVDCDGDGKPDASFDLPCRFILQLREGKIVSVEADRANAVHLNGQTCQIRAYVPVRLP